MTGVYLFDLLSQQARHLAVRQSTIAGNVANANTPGYRARDVQPFAQVMANLSTLGLAATEKAHLSSAEPSYKTLSVKLSETWDALPTSSSVSIEQEMLKASDVSREHALNMSVTKAFDRMLKLSLKSP